MGTPPGQADGTQWKSGMLERITESPSCFPRIAKPPGPPCSNSPLPLSGVACEDLQVGFLSCGLGSGGPWG